MNRIISAALAAAMAVTAACTASVAVHAAQTEQTVSVNADMPIFEGGPEVTDFYNTADGTTVSWTSYPGAAKYRLFFWDGEMWRGVGTTASRSLTHTGLKSGELYRYTVRALDSSGEFCSDYHHDGYVNRFLAPPQVVSVTNVAEGVEITWTDVREAENYRVYRKTSGSGWTRVGDTAENVFVDTKASSGETYSYTVRCITADGSDWTSYYTDGKSVQCVRAPEVTGFYNTADGTEISWKKCAGAYQYRVFMLDKDGVWRGLGNTSDTSFVNKNVTSGEAVTYTVRCLDRNGDFVSAYNRDGWSYTFLRAPQVTSLTSLYEGIEIRWESLAGAENYRVYRKTAGGSWSRIGDTTESVFVDTKAASGVKYSYTVRCITADGSDWTSYYTDGRSIQAVSAPEVTGFYNTADGTEISWKKCDGAAKYRVFMLDKDGVWRGLGNTTDTSFVNKNVKSGEAVTYTVRCLDKNGDFVSPYNKEGWTYTFLGMPVIQSLNVTTDGVVVSWGEIKGAQAYRVYRKTSGSGWTRVGDTTATAFTDKNAKSGEENAYTVRCITADGSDWTSYYNSGKSIAYVKTPVVTAFENTAEGVKLSWEKCGGAYKYGVFYLGNDGWKGIDTTTDTFFIDESVKNGETRTYTVRCLDRQSNFISAYDKNGWTTRFFAPPQIASVSAAAQGNLISWNAADGAAGYRLYRRTVSGGWARLFDSTPETSYQDAAAQANNAYAYTLRLTDDSGKLISSYIDNAKFYYNGKIADGNVTIGGKSYVFKDGYLRQGYVKIGNDTYYFNSNGEMLKDALVGSTAEGFRYAGKDGKIDFKFTGIAQNKYGNWYLENGVLDFNTRKAVTYGGSDWNVLDAKATKVTSEYDKTLHRAFKLVDEVCPKNMSKSDKLWKMFRYIQNAYTEMNPRIPHYKGMDWPIIYANDMFINGKGNCLSYGAEFCFIAKAIGYENIYACHSGGHGWAEIDGKVYDPEWGRHTFDNDYFGIDYNNNPTNNNYKAAIAPGEPWMHIKI